MLWAVPAKSPVAPRALAVLAFFLLLTLCLLFIHPPAHGSEVSPAARNTLDSARIPRASKLLICGLFLKGRVLAQDGVADGTVWSYPVSAENRE